MRMKYFSGEIELRNVYGLPNKEFDQRFPDTKGIRYDSYAKLVGTPLSGGTDLLPVERRIEYKSNPSRHECDARCLNATGRVMKCECACGGKNHGRGAPLRCAPIQPRLPENGARP